MLPADRFRNWVDKTASGWADRLATWGMGMLARGATKTLEGMEPGAIEAYQASLKKLLDDPLTPPELKAFLQKALKPGNIVTTIAAMLLIPLQAIGIALGGSQPVGNMVRYEQDRVLLSSRLDPDTVLRLWLRDKEAFRHWFDDLTQQGWNDERIIALQMLTEVIPGVQDLIRMGVREAFDEDFVRTWKMDAEFEKMPVEWAKKLGLSESWSKYYWRAHWELPSILLGYEMLHRGIITESELKDLMTALDIMPGWRDNLIKASWNVPTRVDIRRFLDLGVIDEARLREIYTALGYHGKDLDDYVLWTKIFVGLPDLLAMWKNGWITLDDVRSQLIGLGMQPDAADQLIKTKVKAVEPTSTAEGKELTKTEIYKGVKTGVISYDQGIELLMDLDYTRDQAEYLLAVNVAVLAGSPETFSEFKDLTGKYKRTVETKGEAMPEELRHLADQVVKLTDETDRIKKTLKDKEATILDEEALPAEEREELSKLRTTLYRAEAELQRVKTTYQDQLAVWRHQAVK